MFEKSTTIIKKNAIYLLLIFDYIVFTLSNVFMKLSSSYSLIVDKIIWYVASMICLFVFSIIWQIVLKRVSLNRAYLFKGTTLFWGIVFGAIIFKEAITVNMIIGVVIVLIGVCITFIGGDCND